MEAVGREREELRGEKVKLEAEVEAVVREREELRGEKVKLEARTKELEAQLQFHQSELESVRDEKESFQHAAESVQQDNQSRVDKLLQENEALRSGKEQVAGDLRELELLRERCEVLRGERDAVKRAAEEQATVHKEESKKLKAFIVKMKRELSETKEKVRGCVCGRGMEMGGWRCVCACMCVGGMSVCLYKRSLLVSLSGGLLETAGGGSSRSRGRVGETERGASGGTG